MNRTVYTLTRKSRNLPLKCTQKWDHSSKREQGLAQGCIQKKYSLPKGDGEGLLNPGKVPWTMSQSKGRVANSRPTAREGLTQIGSPLLLYLYPSWAWPMVILNSWRQAHDKDRLRPETEWWTFKGPEALIFVGSLQDAVAKSLSKWVPLPQGRSPGMKYGSKCSCPFEIH